MTIQWEDKEFPVIMAREEANEDASGGMVGASPWEKRDGQIAEHA